MTSETLVGEITDWLVDQALDDPDIVTLFGTLCERLRSIGVPIERAMVNWTTLHPLFSAEIMVWRQGQAASFQQVPYEPDGQPTAVWLASPLRALVESGVDTMRRRLAGPDSILDFQVFQEFADQGFADWIAFATELHTPSPRNTRFKPGTVASFATRAPRGFSDRHIGWLKRVNRRFAVAVKTIILGRILNTLASTYLGREAGGRVLSGQIRHGDGDTIPSVIWFSDLRNSTGFISHLGRDEFIALLNQFFDCAAGAVIAHGGDVLDFIGDGVIAIFPIVDGDERAATEAATAAIETARLRMRDLNQRRDSQGLERLRFGVGLHRGDVLFGNIGVPERLSFSVIGPTVNAVARIEGLTKVLGVDCLATAAIARHAPDRWRPVGEHILRGFDRAAPLFTLRSPSEPEAASATPEAVTVP